MHEEKERQKEIKEKLWNAVQPRAPAANTGVDGVLEGIYNYDNG